MSAYETTPSLRNAVQGGMMGPQHFPALWVVAILDSGAVPEGWAADAFTLDGDAGCNPSDTTSGHSQGLAALGNVSGHELSESLTDPHGDAWYDSQGEENADKCAWTFGPSLITFKNKTQWKIQGNWSNAVYTNGGSYLGSGSGCINGN